METAVDACFVCEACDAEIDAVVQSYGFSAAPSFFGDEDSGIARAEEDAVARADDTLLFLPCPRCGHRASGRRAVVAKAIGAMLLRMLVVGAIMFIAAQGREMDQALVIWGSLGFAGVVGLISLYSLLTWPWHPWRNAAGRTALSDAPVAKATGAARERREQADELRQTKRKVLYAAIAACVIGGVIALVQYLDRPKPRSRAIPPPSASASAHPSDAKPLSYPVRHVLEVGDRKIDVFEGALELQEHGGQEHVRVLKPWAYASQGMSFLYDPSLTVISDSGVVTAYGDAGLIRLWPALDREDAWRELRDRLPHGVLRFGDAEAVTRSIAKRPISGERHRAASGDIFELFSVTLDDDDIAITVRRTAPEPPTFSKLLDSLTKRELPPRELYMSVVGERAKLPLDEARYLPESHKMVTLRERATIRRQIGTWRFEHPSDVAVMTRGDAVVFSRDRAEIVVFPHAGKSAAQVHPDAGRSNGADVIHEVREAKGHGIRLSYDDATRAAAHNLLQAVVALW